MGKYQFKADLLVAKLTEKEVAELLVTKVAAWKNHRVVLSEGKNVKYDFSLIPPPVHVEVKEDFLCKNTGNIAVEVECRGKPSGLAVTEADWWVYRIHTEDDVLNVLVDPEMLTHAIASDSMEREPKIREVVGGDTGSRTKLYLFKLEDFLKLGEIIKG